MDVKRETNVEEAKNKINNARSTKKEYIGTLRNILELSYHKKNSSLVWFYILSI